MNKISIIIPVYNEKQTILSLLDLVKKAPLSRSIISEIIVIDDYSSDGTREILKNLNDPLISVIYKNKNAGKGSCLQIGFEKASGDIMIIQDADLEYDPADYEKLVEPIIDKHADVVYGSRFIGGRPKNALFFWHAAANRWMSTFSNIFTNLNLTDMATCYKVYNREQVDRFRGRLTCNRFAIDEELTAWVGHGKARVYEVGVSYNGRSYEEGKKINWVDWLEAVWSVVWFNLIAPRSFVERRVTRGWGPLDRFLTIWRSNKAKRILSGSDNERVLDIGCGAYPYFLTKLNFKEKYGIDQSAAKKIPGVDLKQIDFKDSPLPWSDNYFDAITMLAVIEHLDVETAKKLLKDIYRLLKPGGRLVITTPSSGADKLLRLLAKMKLISSEEINDHKQFYTKKLIREQLIESGWSNESISIGYFQIAYNIWALAKK